MKEFVMNFVCLYGAAVKYCFEKLVLVIEVNFIDWSLPLDFKWENFEKYVKIISLSLLLEKGENRGT